MNLAANVFDVWVFQRRPDGIVFLLLYTSVEKAGHVLLQRRPVLGKIPSDFEVNNGESITPPTPHEPPTPDPPHPTPTPHPPQALPPPNDRHPTPPPSNPPYGTPPQPQRRPDHQPHPPPPAPQPTRFPVHSVGTGLRPTSIWAGEHAFISSTTDALVKCRPLVSTRPKSILMTFVSSRQCTPSMNGYPLRRASNKSSFAA